MGNRRASDRRIKSGQPYDVRQAAKVANVTKPTIRRWLKDGLKSVEGVYPTLIRGVDLKAFMRRRSEARKQPCGPDRLFCLRCKAPKTPAYDEVEFHPDGPKLGRLVGICPDCLATLSQRTSRAKLATKILKLRVTFKQEESRLVGTFKPHSNVHSDRI